LSNALLCVFADDEPDSIFLHVPSANEGQGRKTETCDIVYCRNVSV